MVDNNNSAGGFFDRVQTLTEDCLTRRKAKRLAKKNRKKTFWTEVKDWLDAIVFAVVVVFLINQFLFQMFVIPSPSMQDTLLIGDRVWVSKTAYGVELYPYGPKVLGSGIVDRDQIITFYNPEYAGRSPVFSIVSKILYMATLGFWNIDVDENGNPNEWLLVKRAAALPGDTVTFRNGNAYIRPAGLSSYQNEADFRSSNGYDTAPKREIEPDTYNSYNAMAVLQGLQKKGVSVQDMPVHLREEASKLDSSAFFTDYYGFNHMGYRGVRVADPTDMEARSYWTRHQMGLYVPENSVLPLGDNRDNSNDGRYFGPVDYSLLTGRLSSTVWPLSRLRTF